MISTGVAYPQGAPILALFNHLADTVNDIEDPEARLEGVDRFVQIRGGLLALQERAFLLDKAMAGLRDTCIK